MQGQGQGQEQGQGQGQGQGGQTLPTDVLVGMQAVGEALMQAGAPEPLLQKLAQAMKLYEDVLAEISGQSGGRRPEPMPTEQAGTPVSPAGV